MFLREYSRSDATPVALTKDNIYTNFVAIAKALKKANATTKVKNHG